MNAVGGYFKDILVREYLEVDEEIDESEHYYFADLMMGKLTGCGAGGNLTLWS